MATVITSGSIVIAPSAVTGFESSRDARTVVHEIIDRADPDYALRVAKMRTGRMELAFTTPSAEADSLAAETALAGALKFAVLSAERSTVQFSFVVPTGGTITRTLNATTMGAWTVAFDWHEVAT